MIEIEARAAATSALGLLHATLPDSERVEGTGITVSRSGRDTYNVSLPHGVAHGLSLEEAVEAIVNHIMSEGASA